MEVQASALADLTAAVCLTCYCRAGMNHFATALLWGNDAELYCLNEIIVRYDFVSSMEAARQVCVFWGKK